LELAWCVGAVWAMWFQRLLGFSVGLQAYPGQREYDPQMAEIRYG